MGFRSVFSALYTFGKQILDLSVDGSEFVLRPGGEFFIQYGGKTKGNLFFAFLFVFHDSFGLLAMEPAVFSRPAWFSARC